MKIPVLVWFLIPFCMPTLLAEEAETPLDALRSVFSNSMEVIEKDYSKSADKHMEQYRNALDRLQKDQTRRGDLEGLIATRDESKRFEKEKTLPGPPLSNHPRALSSLQSGFRKAMTQTQRKRHERTTVLMKRYLQKLGTLMKSLVRQEKLDRAIVIQAEAEKIKARLAGGDLQGLEIQPRTTTRLPNGPGRGLVLHYTFDADEGDRVSDRSTQKNHGKVIGATWSAEGKIGGAYEFDGKNDWIDCGNDPSLSIPGPMTISLWVKFNSKKLNSGLCTKGTGNGGESWLLDNRFRWVRRKAADGLPVITMNKAGYPPGAWYHLAAVDDGQRLRLYVDGRCVSEAIYGVESQVNDHVVSLGGRQANNGPYNLMLDGLLDEVAIYSRGLSEEEILQLYEAGDGP
jgi:hypothetical protein